ncbi:hypothetical protein U5903_09445 [Cereibacter johrii]|uniref:hypothetical protein n=1 Tax=Cereibacter johrii TaxID=445629 RepID=UPI002B257BDC|nr:hypothetical protein [Cereibacter johrii]MEA5160993.1 hypothetical protein [Cereibacter johrii]
MVDNQRRSEELPRRIIGAGMASSETDMFEAVRRRMDRDRADGRSPQVMQALAALGGAQILGLRSTGRRIEFDAVFISTTRRSFAGISKADGESFDLRRYSFDSDHPAWTFRAGAGAINLKAGTAAAIGRWAGSDESVRSSVYGDAIVSGHRMKKAEPVH